MNWIALVAAAVVLDALRIFIDNYTSDTYFKGREAVAQKWFYGFVYLAMGAAILLATRFGLGETDWASVGSFVLSGFLASLAGVPYFRALEIEDSTNIGIFIQLAPVLYLVLGWFFLGERFSPMQLIAFAVIMAAPILIIATTKKRSRKIKLQAVFYAFIYVLLVVIANLIFVKKNDLEFGFINEIAWLFIGKALGNFAVMIAVPKWRKRFGHVYRSSKKKVLRPMLVNCLVGLGKDFAYRAALVAAPAVAVASAASDSVEPIVIFFMGLVLTLIWPRFGREKLDKKTVLVHLLATALVVAGIVMIQMQNI